MMQYNEIDWNKMWQAARKKKKSGKKRSAGDWDKKADSFRKRTRRSVYTEKFIRLLNPDEKWSVLDMGCGPGTLALPLSGLVSRVTAADFSARMLTLLEQEATSLNISNITTVHASWNDDWSAKSINPHDIVIASRSLAVEDLKAALEKLIRFARKAVFITDRVEYGPLDPDAFAAIGRPMKLGPDYIYTLNLLYQMGIKASVDFIKLDETPTYSSLEQAFKSFTWMFHSELTSREEECLLKYVKTRMIQVGETTWELRRRNVPVWAFISWSVSD